MCVNQGRGRLCSAPALCCAGLGQPWAPLSPRQLRSRAGALRPTPLAQELAEPGTGRCCRLAGCAE